MEKVKYNRTGLSDKNGQEVCLGDVIGYPSSSQERWFTKGRRLGKKYAWVYEIVWDEENARFSAKHLDSEELNDNVFGGSISKCDILGNVTENPELIEVGDAVERKPIDSQLIIQ